MIRRYRAVRLTEIEAITWTGENLDEAAAFLGDAYVGVRRDEHGSQMLLIRQMDDAVTPVRVPPGWKLLRDGAGWTASCRADVFADMYEQVDS